MKKFNVANHIRALLDLLYIGNFTVAQDMNKDLICNPKYDKEIFDKVIMMKENNLLFLRDLCNKIKTDLKKINLRCLLKRFYIKVIFRMGF